MAISHAKAWFRGRTRDLGTQSQITARLYVVFSCGGPAPRIWIAGSEIETLENHFAFFHFETLENHFVIFHFLINPPLGVEVPQME